MLGTNALGEVGLGEIKAPETSVIVVSTPAVTTAGRRSAATSYSYRTLGSIRREKERELAKIARRAQRKVAAAIDDSVLGLQALVTREVSATVPASVTWLTQEMRESIIQSIVDFHRAQWARIQEQEEEEDIEVLLLVA